jgi:hypothetical protein
MLKVLFVRFQNYLKYGTICIAQINLEGDQKTRVLVLPCSLQRVFTQLKESNYF